MIRPLGGWMLVQPLLNQNSANDQLRVGKVHAIGELPDQEMAARIPFKPGDRVCWIEGVGAVHVLNETLLLVSLGAPLAYEPVEPELVEPAEEAA
jgi:co-chaperonin GroES (HSP10)